MHALTMGKPCIMQECLSLAMDGSWLAVFMQAAHAAAFWSDAMSRITHALHEFMKIWPILSHFPGVWASPQSLGSFGTLLML